VLLASRTEFRNVPEGKFNSIPERTGVGVPPFPMGNVRVTVPCVSHRSGSSWLVKPIVATRGRAKSSAPGAVTELAHATGSKRANSRMNPY